jgi:hypothetical protein
MSKELHAAFLMCALFLSLFARLSSTPTPQSACSVPQYNGYFDVPEIRRLDPKEGSVYYQNDQMLTAPDSCSGMGNTERIRFVNYRARPKHIFQELDGPPESGTDFNSEGYADLSMSFVGVLVLSFWAIRLWPRELEGWLDTRVVAFYAASVLLALLACLLLEHMVQVVGDVL